MGQSAPAPHSPKSMDATWAYFLPLLAALIYPVSGLWIKQAMDLGGGVMRTTFISNLGMAVAFLPLYFFWQSEDAIYWDALFWPLLAGAVFFLGQLFTVLAVRAGGISVQAPLMGTKVIFVAAFGTVLSDTPIPLTLWCGAGITTAAVFLLGRSQKTDLRQSLSAVALSLISALFFGLTDSLVAYKSAEFGRIPYLLLMLAVVSLLSFSLVPFFDGRLRDFPKRAWRPALIGGLACGAQAVALNIALGFYGRATAMNIIYSARGIFGIALVWFAGHYFQNTERAQTTPAIMRSRLAGAILLSTAIILVFV